MNDFSQFLDEANRDKKLGLDVSLEVFAKYI